MTSYVGLDVSLAETSVCVLGADGKVRYEGKVRSLPNELVACIQKHADDVERVAIETGQTTAVLFRAMEAANLPVVCIETRHAHKVLSARQNKTDRNDARGLAELVRVGWYKEAWVRGASAQASLGDYTAYQAKPGSDASWHNSEKGIVATLVKCSRLTSSQIASYKGEFLAATPYYNEAATSLRSLAVSMFGNLRRCTAQKPVSRNPMNGFTCIREEGPAS